MDELKSYKIHQQNQPTFLTAVYLLFFIANRKQILKYIYIESNLFTNVFRYQYKNIWVQICKANKKSHQFITKKLYMKNLLNACQVGCSYQINMAHVSERSKKNKCIFTHTSIARYRVQKATTRQTTEPHSHTWLLQKKLRAILLLICINNFLCAILK